MESPKRMLAKSMTWQATGLVSMTVLGAATTGSWRFASGFALASAAIGLVMYVAHERIWASIAWGRRREEAPTAPRARSER